MDPQLACSTFNSLNVKLIQSIKDLPLNQELQILKAERVATKFGDKIRVESEDFFIYLPDRYNEISNSMLEMLHLTECYSLIKCSTDDGKTYQLNLTYKERPPVDAVDIFSFYSNEIQ